MAGAFPAPFLRIIRPVSLLAPSSFQTLWPVAASLSLLVKHPVHLVLHPVALWPFCLLRWDLGRWEAGAPCAVLKKRELQVVTAEPGWP